MFIVVPDKYVSHFSNGIFERTTHLRIIFFFKLGKASSEAPKKVVGESAMERTQIFFSVFFLFRRGENGRRW